MSPPERASHEDKIAEAIASGRNVIAAFRQAIGYSVEEFSLASGLSLSEVSDLESGTAIDAGKARRIEMTMRLPNGILGFERSTLPGEASSS